MQILHADTDDLDNPLRGGQPVRTFEVNSRLADDHAITVLTATYPGCRRRMQRGGLDYRRLGVTVPGFGLSAHLSFMASLGLAVRRLPHDLVVEEFTPPIGFGLLPYWTRKPVISIVQWFNFDQWQRRYRLPFERMMRSIGRRGLYRNFIVQTGGMAAYFRSLTPAANVWTLGCGVDDEAFDATPSDGQYALFVGRLDIDHKGLDLLLDAWSRLLADGHAIPLRLAGDGPGRAFLEQEIARRGLGSVVSLLGRVEGSGKRALLRDAAFLVMPSRYETFGIVALEAMAASKPVIAYDIANLNEVLQPGWSVMVAGLDPDGFSQAVLTLWRDPQRRRQMGDRAFEAAQARRWDTIARQQEAIYTEVVDAAHGR